MASPFRYFRKHTKAFMAIAAVMCMFLFVFVSGTGGGRGTDPAGDPGATVATWNAGSLNEGQLANLVQQRLITDQFLRALFAQGGGQTAYDLPPSVPEFLLRSDRADSVELEVVDTEVFASMAAEAGITVDDAMINYYLQEFGLGRVGTDEIRGILANIGTRNVQSNTAIVFSQLRKLLLSYFYRRTFEDAGAVVLPTQRWDDWRRVNERISLQAAVLPVERFLADVPTPTEAQLRKLYDEFREAVPDVILNVGGRELPSPNPGFAVPRRVKVRYLQGSVAERTAKLLDSVTEEEIADYYERNKRLEFVKDDEEEDFGGEEMDDEAGEEAAEGESATDESEADDAATDDADAAGEGEAATDDGAEPSAAETAEPAAEGDEAADAPPADGASAPADDAAVDETAAEEAAPATEEAEPAADDGDQSSLSLRSPFVLTAFQAEPAADDAAVETAEDAAAEIAEEAQAEASEAADAGAPAEEGEVEPAAESAEETSAEATEAADPAAGAAADAADAASSDAADAAAEESSEEEVVEYVPLDEVRDTIRETLARDKAVDELGKAIGEASAKLQSEYNRYGRAVIEAREKKKPVPEVPARLADLGWLAEAYGLKTETTEALTDRELFETAVGKAVDDQSGRLTVTQAVFSGLELFEPFLAQELEGDWFLVMKVEDTPKRTPEFDDVQDQVAEAWRRIEAAKLAEAKAKELAEEFQESDQTFAEFFSGDRQFDVIEQTALFSWRTYPIGPGLGYSPELSDVPELSNVGPDFMDVAFGLADGEAAGVMNYDRSAAYVIKLHSRQYTPEELRKLFLSEVATWPGQVDMFREREAAFRQVLNRRLFLEVAGFKFDEEWEERRAERFAESQ